MFSDTFYGNLVTVAFFVALYGAYRICRRVYAMVIDYKNLCIERERRKFLMKIILGIYGAIGMYGVYQYGRSWWYSIKRKFNSSNVLLKMMDNLNPEINKLSNIVKAVNSSLVKNVPAQPVVPPIDFGRIYDMIGPMFNPPAKKPESNNKPTAEPVDPDSVFKMAAGFIPEKKNKEEEEKEQQNNVDPIPVNPVVSNESNENIPVIPMDL